MQRMDDAAAVARVRGGRGAWRRWRMLAFALAALAALAAAPASFAAYTFEALGTFGEMASEPAAINDAGRVTGTLTGT